MRTRRGFAQSKESAFTLIRWLAVVPSLAILSLVLLAVLLYGHGQDLQSKAETALKAGDTKGATRYATELLTSNIYTPFSWNYGNVIYDGNQILGLAALKENDIAKAKQCLLAAGNTPGSPQLDSFGPDMTLAQELLKKGEKQVVLDFLDLVAKFWATPKPGEDSKFLHLYQEHEAKIEQWKNAIRSGAQASLNRFDFS
jgi:hypothetical protein